MKTKWYGWVCYLTTPWADYAEIRCLCQHEDRSSVEEGMVGYCRNPASNLYGLPYMVTTVFKPELIKKYFIEESKRRMECKIGGRSYAL